MSKCDTRRISFLSLYLERGLIGVWTVEYSNRYKDTYTITTEGKIILKLKKTTSFLQESDNEVDFPSSDGWFMVDRAHRSATWEYIRLKGNGTFEIQHFCSDGCTGTYKNTKNYCCSGTGRKSKYNLSGSNTLLLLKTHAFSMKLLKILMFIL